MTDLYKNEEEVMQRSKKWISDFNNGDAKACVEAYTAEAIMNAKPLGTYIGSDQIKGFWKPFIESGAGELEYSNVTLATENENTVLLSADWKMNIGRGIITQERWVKQSDGKWLIEYDDFEVQEQY
jgi:ketosteroid isomerase-like protein